MATLLMPTLALLLGVAVGLAPPICRADTQLPDIGSNDTSLITQAHQRQVTEQVMRNLRQQGLIVNDPELSEYIQNLGQRLVSHLDNNDQKYHFFLMKNMEVNAFALPAGYIVVHAGLFLTTHSEDELAAVLSHEIGHVSQHHFSRTEEISKKQSVIMAAALIAALAVGRTDSNASSALLMGGMASSISSSLAYSREHEQEADRVGIELLAKSGFNASAMPEFFERMEAANRFNTGDVPEFLRTHPVTLSRISDARERVAELPKNHHKSSQEYALMWYRLAMLAGVSANVQYQPPPSLHPGTDAYAQALSLSQSNKYPQALKAIKKAVQQAPNQPLMQTAEARIYQELHRPKRAVDIYQQLYELYPTQASIALGYGQALLDDKQPQTAKTVLRRTLDDADIQLPQVYKLLAQTESKLGNMAASHGYLSEYYYDTGNPYAAKTQIEIALKQDKLNFYEKEELQARLKALREHLQLLSKMSPSSS